MNVGNICHKPSCVNCIHMHRVGGGNFKCCEPTMNPNGNIMSIQLAFNNTCKKYVYDEEPVKVTRDSGYSKLKLISPENRKKARKNAHNPNIVTGKYRLKDLFAKRGIVVIPEKMTLWYQFTE